MKKFTHLDPQLVALVMKCPPQVIAYCRALQAENLRLQNQIARLRAAQVTEENGTRVAERQHRQRKKQGGDDAGERIQAILRAVNAR